MMCPKCGRTFPDGTQCPCGAPTLSSNPAVNLIKTLGSSNKFLAAAILTSVMVLFSIMASMGSQDLLVSLYYYGANYGLDPDVFYPALSVLENSLGVGAVVAAIPSILIAVGMWMFYVSCRSTQSGNVSTAGLTLCKVLSIISLVMFCLAVVVALVAIVVVLVAVGSVAGDAYYSEYGSYAAAFASVQVLLGFFAMILLGVLALYIVYYICIVKIINRVKASAVNGVPDNRVPRFLTGFMMFLGVLGLVSGVISLIASPVAGIGSLAGAVSLILLSLLLGEYRAKMTMLLFPPVQPMYGNMPPYDAAAPQQPGGPEGPTPQ